MKSNQTAETQSQSDVDYARPFEEVMRGFEKWIMEIIDYIRGT